jgi:hypothetical protein
MKAAAEEDDEEIAGDDWIKNISVFFDDILMRRSH